MLTVGQLYNKVGGEIIAIERLAFLASCFAGHRLTLSASTGTGSGIHYPRGRADAIAERCADVEKRTKR